MGDIYQAKLLRVEVSVSALEPIVSEKDDNMMVVFHTREDWGVGGGVVDEEEGGD